MDFINQYGVEILLFSSVVFSVWYSYQWNDISTGERPSLSSLLPQFWRKESEPSSIIKDLVTLKPKENHEPTESPQNSTLAAQRDPNISRLEPLGNGYKHIEAMNLNRKK